MTMRQLGLSLINRPTLPMDHGTHGWNCPCTSPLQHTQPLYPWTYKPSLPMDGYTRLPSLYRACIASKPLNRLTHDGTLANSIFYRLDPGHKVQLTVDCTQLIKQPTGPKIVSRSILVCWRRLSGSILGIN